jgi:hypothetical protein
MLVHFIGGPIHGRSEAVQNPLAVYRVAEMKRQARYAGWFEEEYPPIEQSYEEHSYRITRRTPRYAIAEWEAPKVPVRFLVDLEIDPFDREASQALYSFTMNRREPQRGPVQCVGADMWNAEKLVLTLNTSVEGPPDAVAIQLAAEAVQNWLDANFPASVHRSFKYIAADTIG